MTPEMESAVLARLEQIEEKLGIRTMRVPDTQQIKTPRDMLRWAACEIESAAQFLLSDRVSKNEVIEMCYILRCNTRDVGEEIIKWLSNHDSDVL